MSEQNSTDRGGVFGTITAVVARLSPEFIAVVLLNVGMLWLFAEQNSARERVLAPILDTCAHSVPIEVLKYMEPFSTKAPAP
jgi:hypothetical protein